MILAPWAGDCRLPCCRYHSRGYRPRPWKVWIMGLFTSKASLVAQTVKRLPAMWETWVRFLGQEDPLEKEMAIHSSTLAWKIPWAEEPDRLQSTGPQRVGQNWATSLHFTVVLPSLSFPLLVIALFVLWLFQHEVHQFHFSNNSVLVSLIYYLFSIS